MSIPPFDLALRRRIPVLPRLMAEYAPGRLCVRTAAGGFSPEGMRAMLREKARHDPGFHFMLESGTRSFQAEPGAPGKIMSEKSNGRNAIRKRKLPQKRKFFSKKRKKARQFLN